MFFNITILLFIVIGVILSRFLWGRFRKTRLNVKSMAFNVEEIPPVIVGNLDVNVPMTGDGLYVIGIERTGSTVNVKTLHAGVLTTSSMLQRLDRMGKFYDSCIENGSKTIVVFSVGTTHQKPALEDLRVGIASGAIPEAVSVLKKYGMKRFLSLEHGVRQPYILIHDPVNKVTLREITGYPGGNLYASIMT